MALDLALAERITRGAIERAQQMGIKLTIATVDSSGTLVHLSRMDGANFLSPEIATGKAVTAAAWRLPSADIEKRGMQRANFFASVATAAGRRPIFGRGALPVVIDGEVVGAVGASGGTSEEDEEAVRAGIESALS